MADEKPIKLTELALPGEGGDRAFRSPSGRLWRAKVQISHVETSKPPATQGAASAVPNTITARLSVAELDENKKVKESGGQLLIFDAHEILFDHDAMSDPEMDFEAAIDRALALAVEVAEQTTANRAKLLDHLASKWGAGLVVPEVSLVAVGEAPEEPLRGIGAASAFKGEAKDG